MRNLQHKRVPGLSALLIIVALLAPAVQAQSLINVYNIGGPQDDIYFRLAYGLASDSSSLYLSSSSSSSIFSGWIFQYDLNGTRIDSFATPLGSSQGLTWTGSHFWYFSRSTTAASGFYKVTPTGTVVDTILTGTQFIGGVYWDGTGLWYSLYFPNNQAALYKMDVNTHTIVDTIPTLGTQPEGIAFDGTYFYYAMDDNDGDVERIYIYDPSIEDTVGFIPISDPISNGPKGLVWDGQHLWLIADPVGTVQRALFEFDLGGGGTPNISIPVTEIDFGLTEIGQTASRQLTVFNIGTATLSVDSVQLSNPRFVIDSPTFPLSIPANGSAILNVTFTPQTYGAQSGNLRVFSTDPGEPFVDVALSGLGVNADPTIALTAASHDFGTVWVPMEGLTSWDLDISNHGNQDLILSSLVLDSQVFSLQAPAPPLVIAPNDTTEVTLWFEPQAASFYIDTLRITSNDPATAIAEVELRGSGQAGPFNLGYEFWHYQVPDNPSTNFDEFRVLALKSINDVTGDGTADVIMASRNYWTICLNGASSGFADDIWRFSTYISSFSAGAIGNSNDLPPQQRALAIANDLNGDGFQDVVIGTGGGNEHVYTLDGTNGNIIWQFGTDHPDSLSLGDITSVYVNEDFNGDSINDVIATGSATDNGLGGRRRVYCFDGTNGHIIWQYFVGSFIRMAVTLGDVNNNGSVDVVAGTGDGVSNTYAIIGIDSNGPSLLWSFPIGSAAGGGRELLRYDIPNETSDVIAGSYFGKVYRLDGQTGSQVWLFNLGSSGINQLSLLHDVDGDGFDDILVSSFASTFYCISGADGVVIWSLFLGNFSWSAQSIPDITADGIDDVVLAARTDILYVLDGSNGAILFQRPMNSGTLQGATLAYTLPDIDNSHAYEILGASDDGQIVALSGGTNPVVPIEPDNAPAVPARYDLAQNFPNPFNPTTQIKFALPERSRVTLTVHDILGRQMAVLYQDSPLAAGEHSVTFSAKDLPSGVYFYHLQAGDFNKTRKMILLR